MSTNSESKTFAIRRDRLWKVPLTVIGANESNSRVVVGPSHIDLEFGAYKSVVKVDNIESVEITDWPWYNGVGIRVGADETLGLVGSRDGVVLLTLREAEVSFLGARCRKVVISLEEPGAFIDAVEALVADRAPAQES